MGHGRIQRVLEFLVIGIAFGVTEDLLAILIATDATFSPEILVVVVAIAIPFAIFSELIVDHPRFLHFDRLAITLRRAFLGSSPPAHPPGTVDRETAPWPHHDYRCAICETDYVTGALLHEHVDREHQDISIRWLVTADQARM